MPPACTALLITGAETVGGMSGSPIIDGDGRAIGIVCTSNEDRDRLDRPHAHLIHSLPRWVPPLR